MINIQIAKNLKELMKQYNINQVGISKEIGVAQSAVSAWLSGKKEPITLSLWLLDDYFDCTIDELVGRSE